MHSTHVGIVRERPSERFGLAFCVRGTREIFRRWIPALAALLRSLRAHRLRGETGSARVTERANAEISSREWGLVKEGRGKRLGFSSEGSDLCENSPFLTGESRAGLWAIPGCAGGAQAAFKRSYSVTCLRSVSRWTLLSGLWILEWLCMLEYKQWSLLFPFPRTFTCWKMSEEAKEKNAKPAHRKKKGKKVTPCTDSLL